MAYAWIIDTDHLAEGPDDHSDAGRTGPSRAHPEHRKYLSGYGQVPLPVDAQVYRFEMRDDDGELYYTGRLLTTEGETERAIFGPLHDYGMPGAGCTTIRYPGRKGLDPA